MNNDSMNSRFKSYNYKLFVASLVALAPLGANAKTAQTSESDTASADKEMVQVAYRKVAKDDILGGVSVVDVENLMKKNYHTYSLDNMQGYVGGWNGNSLWGMDADNAGYLVLVDGVPREANNVQPSEIAQISFLKGAQAVVLYGSKAAKGAVVITTKRGHNDGLKVEVQANAGLNVAKSYPEYLSSAEYMTLYNEARRNDGLSELYSAEDIYNHGAGLNPYRYPNLDFYSSDYLRKMNSRYEATAEISGGGKRAHFYSNINYYRQGDYFKFGEAKNNNTQRFSVRGNVDIDITDDIKAWVNSSATFYDSHSAKGNYWEAAATWRPNFPQNAAPLISTDMIAPNAKAAWDLMSVAKLVDGKYFLAGTQANSSNVFADIYSAGSSKFTSRQFQFDTGGKYFLAGTQANSSNVFADIYSAGSSKFTSRQFQFDTGININLHKVLKGLSFETHFAVDYATSYNTSFDNSYAVYIPTWANVDGKVNINLHKVLKGLSFETHFAVDYATSYNTSFDNSYAVYIPTWANVDGKDMIVALKKEGEDKKSGNQNISGSTDNQTMFFSGQFNYNNTFNKVHNLSAMLIASGFQQSKSGQYHKNSSANLAFDASYNYAQKYYADFGLAAIHSAQLAPGHREALSPSLSLGWRLKNESFLKNSKVVDDMMISVSGSIINEDIDIANGDNRYYLYQSIWTSDYGYGWYDGSSDKYTYSKRGENKDLDFIKRKELSLNFKTSLWQKLVTLDASFFINSMEGYLISSPTFYPSHLNTGYPAASFMPVLNYNNNRRVGFDFAANFNKKVGDVDLSLGVTGTYYTTKATKRDENNVEQYQNRQGKALDGIWGYKSAGLFQSEEEIKTSPDQSYFGGTVKPGDIKYVDVNGDNKIDQYDQVFLGKGGWYGAPFTLGVNLTAKWKNFTFFALGTGNFGAWGVKNNSYWWVKGDSKYSAVVRNRWTEETKETATYPRLTSLDGNNNFQTSDFWMYKTDAFRLAKVQITYDLPSTLFQKTWLKGLSAYVSGANLLTISGEREVLEMNVGSAPQTRYYNIGVKATF